MGAGGTVLPWTETNPRVEQEKFIRRHLGGEESFAQLCRAFGISRKTGYKRLKRFEESDFEGLGDRSRAPHSCV